MKVINFLGTFISWAFYKLLYSHFFGYSIKTTDFSDSKKYQTIMWKYTLLTIFVVNIPIFLLNTICLFTIYWGNQLYIELIENILIAVVMSACTIIEHKLMLGNQANDSIRRAKKSQQMMLLNHLNEDPDMTQAQLLAKVHKRNSFVTLSIE